MTDGEWIYGRNPVLETMRAGRRRIMNVKVASGVEMSDALTEILDRAEHFDIALERVSKAELEKLNEGHQGVVALASAYTYVDLQEISDYAAGQQEDPFWLLLDVLQDPQNLGTLLRTAEAVGVHGVVIPPKHSAMVTPAVVSASSGASEHLRIAQHNLAQTIRSLKGQGVWVVGLEASPHARLIQEVDLSGPIALVVGHEGSGLRRLVRESCDFLMRIPMRGAVESLNAAVAGSIALFHVWEKRNFTGSGA